LPVTIATAERSFSKLRLIKNYYIMGQDRLCVLALLSIEAESAELMKTEKLTEKLTDSSASAKACKKMFLMTAVSDLGLASELNAGGFWLM